MSCDQGMPTSHTGYRTTAEEGVPFHRDGFQPLHLVTEWQGPRDGVKMRNGTWPLVFALSYTLYVLI